LPTNATDLGNLLRERSRGHASGEDNEVWESVIGRLMEGPASPELRRALRRVAAAVPGVELAGAVTDSAGRQGTAAPRRRPRRRCAALGQSRVGTA